MRFPNWFRITDRGFELPVAIFDMDGVLSDAGHRQQFLRTDPPDWDSFGALAHLDPPLEFGHAEATRFAVDHCIVVVTARPAPMFASTHEWLVRHGFPVDLAILRPEHDFRPSHEVKRDQLMRIREHGGDIRVAYEDEIANLDMYRSHDVETVYVHSGYYDDVGEL